MTFEPTRTAGLARLQAFLPHAGRFYAPRRNMDYGPVERSNVSTLSPYLRRRLVSEEEVARAVLSRHSLKSAAAFIQELCWRTYWKGWLETRPGVWSSYLDGVDAARERLEAEPELSARYENAVAGAVGLAPFDAWAKELVETGYLHNHARMWFASIWLFTLKLPWELGADLFLRHLVDGDPASNTLSWRWVGGLHTPGKTYLATSENIHHYTGARFDALPGVLAETAPPVDGVANPEPAPAPLGDDPPDPPFALLLTDEDLDPFAIDPGLQAAEAVGGACFTGALSPSGVSDKVAAFAEGAMSDALGRAARACGDCAAKRFEDLSAQALADWAYAHAVDVIVTPYAPMGPAREALDALAPELEDRGVRLVRPMRAWDEAFWPHASAGYFKLRPKIPETLARLGFDIDPGDDAAFIGASGRRAAREADDADDV